MKKCSMSPLPTPTASQPSICRVVGQAYTALIPTNVKDPGTVLQAIALSPDGKYLYAASASLDAVAVFESRSLPRTDRTGGR